MNNPIPSSDRNPNGISFGVIAALTLFIGLQVAGLFSQRTSPTPSKTARLSQQVTGSLDDETVAALANSSLYCKLAYSKPTPDGYGLSPDLLNESLESALIVEDKSGNAPGPARRVIVLRLLLHQPAFGKAGDHGYVPSDAFTKSLPSTVSRTDRANYLTELGIWTIADGNSIVDAKEEALLAGKIRNIPNIGWWQYPALLAFYNSQRDKSHARQIFTDGQSVSAISLIPVIVAMPVVLGMIVVGILLLIFLLFRQKSEPADPNTTVRFNLWPDLPEPIRNADRKLSGDLLWTVFCFYLFLPTLEGWLISGSSGILHSHLLRFSGLITSYLPAIHAWPQAKQLVFVVLITSAGYLIGALIPMSVLFVIARQRGASLADELGWHTRNIRSNLVYGALGYCVGLPLLLISGLLGARIFRGAPAPSNPAISLLSDSSSLTAQITLVVLATIAAPLCEEFFFRGVFFQGARQTFGPKAAILLTGFIFGIAHPVGITGMVTIGVLGCVLAWIAETRKSLAASMVGHFLQNLGATMAVMFLVSR